MTWVFLSVAAVETIHDDKIEKYGGSFGLRDAALLGSAVARTENAVYYELNATVASVGASLSFGLIKNHAFMDGNKRVGLGALVDFLRLNGYKIGVSEEEQIAMIKRAAASEINEEEWTAWVERSVVPYGSER